jgi:hypothetical protein
MDTGCAVLDVGYRTEKCNAPPEISGEAFLKDK